MILRDGERTFGTRTFRLTLSIADELPPASNISTAHCLGFDADGRFLLTRHVDRQWTIPGGHLDPGETAEQAMHRETLEEAAARVADPVLVAVERIEPLDGLPDRGYTNPAFQVFFVTRVVELGLLVPNAECTESGLFAVDEARQLPGWMDHNQELFDAALELDQRRR